MKVYLTETGVAEERTGGSLRARFLTSPAFKSLWVSMGIIIEIILIIITFNCRRDLCRCLIAIVH